MAGDDDRQGPTLQVASAGTLILLQVFSRFLTLFMTQMQIRLTSAEVLGAASIHFELLLGLVLALSREGFRTALSRTTTSTKGEKDSGGSPASIRNIALLPVPIGVCISSVAMHAYTTYLAPSLLVQHGHFAWATRTFVAGAILELLAEPLYIKALMQLDTLTRVVAEGMAVAVKGASTLLALWYIDSTSTLLPFGIGQMGYGATFLLVFFLSDVRRSGFSQASRFLLPSALERPLFNAQSLQLSVTMTRQNVVKHALGEGDKIAVARLASLSDQGSYALASNYGSLVARMLYQPLEESSRLTFARALGDDSAPSTASIDLATDLLANLLSFHVLFSLFLAVFCPPFSASLLLVLAGRQWATKTSAPAILSIYGSLYLPAMAFNGLLEGFLQSCASPSQLTRYAYVLVGASALFISTLFTLHSSSLLSPERRLIVASSLSTAARALYSYLFSTTYLADKQQRSHGQRPSRLAFSALAPHPITLATFALSAVVVRWQPVSIQAGLPLAHLATGITCASLCAAACFVFERATLLGTLRAILGRRKK